MVNSSHWNSLFQVWDSNSTYSKTSDKMSRPIVRTPQFTPSAVCGSRMQLLANKYMYVILKKEPTSAYKWNFID